MEHVRPTELIQLAAGELGSESRARVLQHLDTCAACAQVFKQQQRVHAVLGEWDVVPPGIDRVAGLARKLDSRPQVVIRPFWGSTAQAGRVAAAVLLGVGLGYGAARAFTPGSQSPPAAPAVAQAETPRSAESPVDVLADPSPAGLYAALLDMTAPADDEEGRS